MEIRKNKMLGYVIHSEDIEQILGIVYDVLHIGVSFFDVDFNELGFLHSGGRFAPYCSYRRKDSRFLAACRKCDKKHFDLARASARIQIYRCHCGLFDGIVPLYDEEGHFLGGIVFGQARPDDRKNPHPESSKPGKLYNDLPEVSQQKMLSIGRLLKLTTELIVQKRMIEFKKLGWSRQADMFIDVHLNQKITLEMLCESVGKSPSYLTHHFREEFGMNLTDYIKKRKMRTAIKFLQSGLNVKKTAEKLGYYDAYHFSRAFKRFFGGSPKNFRSLKLES